MPFKWTHERQLELLKVACPGAEIKEEEHPSEEKKKAFVIDSVWGLYEFQNETMDKPEWQVEYYAHNPGRTSGPPEHCEEPSTDVVEIGTRIIYSDALDLLIMERALRQVADLKEGVSLAITALEEASPCNNHNECNCECHEDPENCMHVMACCFTCPACGMGGVTDPQEK